MCSICELAGANANPGAERDMLMDTAAKAMTYLMSMPLSDSTRQYATILTSLIGMQDTMINLLLQTGNPDGVPRLTNLMKANVTLLVNLLDKSVDKMIADTQAQDN